MLKLAITGGLCSGKSAVSALLRERSWPVVDADRLGHDLLQTEARAAIVERFGPSILDGNGAIGHRRLAEVVFAPGAGVALADLNRILHPLIMARAWEHLRQWEQQGMVVAGVEAALLIEAGLQHGFDRVIVVTAERELRIERFQARTGASRQEAEARMAHQLPDARKVEQADMVIANDDTLAALAARVGRMADRLLAEARA
ncbi:MAG: dephospho-CoA kinase [Terriglobales bacterium]